MSKAESTVIDGIKLLLERRGEPRLTVEPASSMSADLNFDSLELAELSAMLEDALGDDPYTEGIIPETVGELIAYYDD